MSERVLLVVALTAGLACFVVGCAIFKLPVAVRFFNSSSALLGIASIFQLRVSGWFESVIIKYGDAEKFPFGPPSHITRQIIDNPDHPIGTWFRNTLLFDPNTGAYMGIASLLVAVVAAWR